MLKEKSGIPTLSWTDVLCDSEPDVPVTVTVDVLVGVEADVEIVNCALMLPPEGTETGFVVKLQAAPAGKPEQESVTGPVKLFLELTGTEYVPVDWPAMTCWLEGLGVPKLKSGVVENGNWKSQTPRPCVARRRMRVEGESLSAMASTIGSPDPTGFQVVPPSVVAKTPTSVPT